MRGARLTNAHGDGMARNVKSVEDTIAGIHNELVDMCNAAWRREVHEQCARAGLDRAGGWTVEDLADEVARLQQIIRTSQTACESLQDIDPIHSEDCGCRDWSVRRCNCSAQTRFRAIRFALGMAE